MIMRAAQRPTPECIRAFDIIRVPHFQEKGHGFSWRGRTVVGSLRTGGGTLVA